MSIFSGVQTKEVYFQWKSPYDIELNYLEGLERTLQNTWGDIQRLGLETAINASRERLRRIDTLTHDITLTRHERWCAMGAINEIYPRQLLPINHPGFGDSICG